MTMEIQKITEAKTAIGLAHSKLILVGEHAVVHGQPAIAIPFPLIGVESSVESYVGDVYLESSLYKGPLDSAPKELSGVVNTVKRSFEMLNLPYRDILIRVESTIPPGKGLGSSASVAIAIAKSLFAYVDKPYTNEELLYLANISETYAHGAPSGIDPLTITSESPIWYMKDTPIDYILPKGQFHFVVADSGEEADTKTAVSTVSNLLKATPQKIYNKIERIGEITHEVRDALEKASKNVLGSLLDEAQKNLEAIGVSNDTLNHLIEFVKEQGALGAKLTGSGNGGCIIALAQNELHSLQLLEKLKQYGAENAWAFTLGKEKE